MTATREDSGLMGSRVRAALSTPLTATDRASGPAPILPVRVTVQMPTTLQPAFAALQARASRWMKRGTLILALATGAYVSSWLVGRGSFTADPPTGLIGADIPAVIADGFAGEPDELAKLRDYVYSGQLLKAHWRNAEDQPVDSPEAKYVLAQSAYYALSKDSAITMPAKDYQALKTIVRTLVKDLVPEVDAHPDHYDPRTLYVLEHYALDRVATERARSVERAIATERDAARQQGRIGKLVAVPLMLLGLVAFLAGLAMARRVERIESALGRTNLGRIN